MHSIGRWVVISNRWECLCDTWKLNLARFSVRLWIRSELTVSKKYQAYALSLTRGVRGEVAAICRWYFQTFCSTNMVVFWFNFHWNMFSRVQLTINQTWFREWLGADKRAFIWAIDDLIWWRIYASLSSELRFALRSKSVHRTYSIFIVSNEMIQSYPRRCLLHFFIPSLADAISLSFGYFLGGCLHVTRITNAVTQ